MNAMNSNKRKLIKSKQGQVECEFCKKSFSKTSILVHIGKNESCKSHYGSRFDEQKRKANCLRKQLSRKKLGKEKELKRKRESYAQNKKVKENKRQSFQDEEPKLAVAGGFEKVNNTSRESDASKESIKFDSPTSYTIDMSALHANVVVLNPNQAKESNEIAKKDYNVLCKCCKKRFLSRSLLRHIGRNKSCKLFYGVEFENIQKRRTHFRKKKERLAREEEKRRTQKEDLTRKEMIDEKEEVRQVSKDIADDVEKVSCEFCKKKFVPSTILIHIGMNKSCKEHYGSKFEEMKKEKKKKNSKENYNLNQEKIKAHKKKEYDAMKEYMRKKAQEGAEKRHVEFMVDWKKTRDEKVRYHNDNGLESARKDLLHGRHIISQCKPSEENEKIMKELEKKIEKTYEEFQTKIREAFESAKDVDSSELVKEIYLEILDEHLVFKDSRAIWRTWHDLQLSINVKFIKMAKKMGKNYPGNMTCTCHKCQDGIGVKNIKKACVNHGFPEPKDRRFAYCREHPR